MWTVIEGDARHLPLADASVDAVVCDPPYGLEFMGKEWDRLGRFDARDKDAKSGSMNRANAPIGTSPTYVGGSASQAWHETWAREALRVLKPGGHLVAFGGTRTYHRMVCAVEDAGFEIRDTLAWMYGSGFPKSHNLDGAWQGWGTALKPAHEPIVLARKPLAGTVAANVLEHGTGALNVDGCRVPYQSEEDEDQARVPSPRFGVGDGPAYNFKTGKGRTGEVHDTTGGRWPANVILDAEAGAMVGEEARFMYCPKPDRAERNVGGKNVHPTVKPVALMQWLCRLVTPPKGLVLDPFTGSGTTGMAALREGFSFVGVERDAEYVQIARARILGDAPLLNGTW